MPVKRPSGSMGALSAMTGTAGGVAGSGGRAGAGVAVAPVGFALAEGTLAAAWLISCTSLGSLCFAFIGCVSGVGGVAAWRGCVAWLRGTSGGGLFLGRRGGVREGRLAGQIGVFCLLCGLAGRFSNRLRPAVRCRLAIAARLAAQLASRPLAPDRPGPDSSVLSDSLPALEAAQLNPPNLRPPWVSVKPRNTICGGILPYATPTSSALPRFCGDPPGRLCGPWGSSVDALWTRRPGSNRPGVRPLVVASQLTARGS